MITASMAPPAPPVIDLTHGTTSLGTWFFWPALIIGALLIIGGLAAVAIVREGWPLFYVLTGAVAAGFALVMYWPLDYSYHRWYPVTGVVADAPTSRLLSDGDKVSQRFAIRFTGGPQLFGCDDTRCASVHAGDRLYLLCKREWQYQGVPGWSCVFNQP